MLNDWISVEDRLPEVKTGDINDFAESGLVLCFTNNNEIKMQKFGWLNGKSINTGRSREKAVYWMPLPKKPK